MSKERSDVYGRDAGTPINTREAAASQDAFWSRRFAERDYTVAEWGYDYYRPAYRHGWQWARQKDGSFDAVEKDLEASWDEEEAGLSWDEARAAVRDAYEQASNTDASDPGNPLA